MANARVVGLVWHCLPHRSGAMNLEIRKLHSAFDSTQAMSTAKPLSSEDIIGQKVCLAMLDVRNTDQSRSMTAAVRSPVFFRLHDH